MTILGIDAPVGLDSPLWSVDGLPVGIAPPSLCQSPTGLHVWLRMLSTADTEHARWGDALWGEGRWSSVALDALMRDVIADAVTVRWRRGAPSLLEQPEAGEVSLELVNPSGIYSPFARLIDAAYVRLDARIPVQVAWADTAGAVPLFTGHLDGLSDVWEPGSPDTGRPERDFVVGDGFDNLALLATVPAASGSDPTELAGDRVHRLLDDAGWPATLREVDDGTMSVDGDDDARRTLEALQRVGLSEGGRVYIGARGELVYEDAGHQAADHRQLVPQLVLTDRTAEPIPGDPVPVVCYDLAQAITDRAGVVNRAEVSTALTAAEIAEDTTSQATYGTRVLRLVTILSDPSEQLTRANRLIDQFAYASRRISRISVDLGRRADQRRAVCELELGDRIRFVRHPVSGDLLDVELVVTAIEHEVTAAPNERDEWWAHIETGPVLLEAPISRWGEALWNVDSWEP